MDRRLLSNRNVIYAYFIFGCCQFASLFMLLIQTGLFVDVIAVELFHNEPVFTPFTTPQALTASLVLVLIRMLLNAISAPLLGYVSATIKADLREKVHRHLLKLGPTFVQRERSGELVTSLTEGLDKLDAYFREYIPSMIVALIFCPIIIYYVSLMAVEVSVIMGVTIVLIFLALMITGIMAGKRSRIQHAELGKMGADFLDVMRDLTTLRLLNQSQAQGVVIQQSSENFRQSTMAVLRTAFLSSLTLEMISTISIALVAIYISGLLLNEQILFQYGLFILMILPEFYATLRTYGVKFHVGKEGLANLERLNELLDTPAPTIAYNPTLPTWNTIRFDDVHFAYTEDRPALNGVTLTIKRGQTVALVGDSGSGKSTINALLLGFVQPQTGAVRLDDVALDQFSAQAWRDQIAWVSQRPYLFNASIADNIRMGKQTATHQQVIHAAQQAGAHDFIMALPQGYDTPCGERGYSLSGGQAGRVAIARAFLKDADVLILDEPTANLDPDSEALVLEALARLGEGRTVVSVAHRLDTITDADQIIVLEDGRVVETGDHASLIAQGGRYARMRGNHG